MLSINGKPVKSPSSMEIQFFDIGDASRRNAAGEQIIDRIATKRKISMEWSVMSKEQLAVLISAMGSEPFFEITYPEPTSGASRTATCSCEERSMGILRMAAGIPTWQDVAMTWVER